MKSKNIPDDIRSKSSKEAQIEIKETSAYKSLVIYDNFKKKIFYIQNIFKDEQINNYDLKYQSIKTTFKDLKNHNVDVPQNLIDSELKSIPNNPNSNKDENHVDENNDSKSANN